MNLTHGFERPGPQWKRELRYMLRPEQRRIDELQFMSREMYDRIAQFPLVHILPPFDAESSSESERFLALGLSRQLIRNLMLVRNMSIRGPEDSSRRSYDQVAVALQREPEDILITGVVKMESGLRCDFEIHRRDQKPQKVLVQQREFSDFLESCTRKLASALKADVSDLTEAGWKVGQPAKLETVVGYGGLIDAGEHKPAANIESILDADAGFSMASATVSDDKPAERHIQNRAMQHDAFNAQLMWQLSMSAFDVDMDFDMLSFRFKKRAVELSPGHGKAHMCMPHNGANDIAYMLPHSWLGYYLLPTNAFAINNLIAYMRDDPEGSQQREILMRLAFEAIYYDRDNPDGYERLIELYNEDHRYADALHVSEALLDIYEEMSERTRFTIAQSEQGSAWLEEGWDPAVGHRKRMDELRAKIAAGEGKPASGHGDATPSTDEDASTSHEAMTEPAATRAAHD